MRPTKEHYWIQQLATIGVVFGEAYSRTSRSDAQSAVDARYTPLSNILTRQHVREVGQSQTCWTRTCSKRHDVEQHLIHSMDTAHHDNESDVRRNAVCMKREKDWFVL
jgi:hypothetical protein